MAEEQGRKMPKTLDGFGIGVLNQKGVYQCPACRKKGRISGQTQQGAAETREYARRGAKRYFKCIVCAVNFIVVDLDALSAEQRALRDERRAQLKNAVGVWEDRLASARSVNTKVAADIAAAQSGLDAAKEQLAAFLSAP